MTEKVYTANRVADGRVVFLDAAGGWTEAVAESRVVTADDEADARAQAEHAAETAEVVDPYLIDVATDGGVVRPVRYRERIRAYGPSIHPDFAKVPAGHPDHPGG